MDNCREITEVFRKASLASITKTKGYNEFSKDPQKPKDNFYIVHIFSFFFGLLNMLPLSFFVTANDYWMYKFRDISKGTVDLNNKTTLQTYFTSGSLIVQTVPSMIFMMLSTTIGHKFDVNLRIIFSLASKIIIFVVFTIFIKVDTDSWQVLFFATSMIGLSLISGFLNLFQVSSLALIPKFPEQYMKTFLFGQGMAGIFSGVVQIISLALGTSTQTSALVYFITGTTVVVISFVLYLLCQKNAFYQYYIKVNLEDKKRTYTRAEVKGTFKKIWPILSILFFLFLTMNFTHPCVTSLVVSDNYGNGSDWNDLYFVPAITFLFTETCSQMGRLLSRPLVTKSNGSWIVGFSFIRTLILVPLVMCCNAQPRSHLPVLFPHDWQYILICIVYFITSGFLLNAGILSIPILAPENQDVAYLIMMSVIGVVGGALSPISLLAVRIL